MVDALVINVIIVLMEKCERHTRSLAEGQIKELGSSWARGSRQGLQCGLENQESIALSRWAELPLKNKNPK